jgi:hypothetical protein
VLRSSVLRSSVLRCSVLRGQGSQRLELRLEQRLVDLPLIDRHVFLEADADHFIASDPDFLREVVRRQVVGHLAPSRFTPRKSPPRTMR